MKDLALLILRLTLGLFMAGHGTQKLFGWFKGPGLKGTAGFMEQLGMAPGRIWGPMAAFSESAGGTLTALGFLSPAGPLNIMAAMAVATRRAHWKLPLWATKGGAELPATNLAAAMALALSGPGRYSLDHVLGLRIPRWMNALMTLTTLAGVYAAVQRPELAEKVVTTTAARVPAVGDLIVENRPRQETREEAPQPTPTV
jgi:putative oxidoreductase